MYYNFKNSEIDKYIYRIISLERLLELFITNKNTLAKPEKWEDKFENFILKAQVKLVSGEIEKYNHYERIYGQCWTLESSSDAMWRIYSPNRDGLQIRTTIRKLLEDFYDSHPKLPDVECCIGKVDYLNDKDLEERANNTFDDSGISIDNIFWSLLIKRNAFKHENEVRLLYYSWTCENYSDILHKYSFDPHKLISQIVVDPIRSDSEFQVLKKIIRTATGYEGLIKRSLLYTLPKDIVLTTTNLFADD